MNYCNSKYKVILFDIDDTLICNEGNTDERFQVIFDKIFKDFDITQEKYFKIINELRGWYFKNKKMDLSPTFSRSLFWHKVFKNLHISLSISQQKAIIDTYWSECLNSITLKPDVKKVLSKLKKSGFKLGVLSNGDFYSKASKLITLKIDRYFQYVFPTELVSKNKFSEDIYKYVIKFLDIEPNKVVMIGDTLEQDIIPANKVGLTTILIGKNDEIAYLDKNLKPDFLIEELNAILKIIMK